MGSRQYGTVILTRSLSQRFLTLFFVLIAIGIIAFFVFFGTTRKAQSQGVLLPTAGVIRIVPTQIGIVTEVRVKEGQQVRAGDVLFVLSSERSSGSAESTQKAVSALLQSRRDSFASELDQSSLQSRQRIAAVQRRANDLTLEIERLGEQIGMQQTRVALSEQAYKRFEELQKTNYLSAAQLQDKQAEVLDQRQRLADVRRAVSSANRDLAAAEAEVRDMQVQGQREAATIKRNISAIEQDLTESEARREVLLRAPQAGVVTAITGDRGQTVAGNTVLASLLPEGAKLEAEIYALSRSVGFIRPGMTVLLRYSAYPYQKFGQHRAVVREVASTSLRPDELGVPGATFANSVEPLYRIRLELDQQFVVAYGKKMPLKSGMLIDASVQLEHRRLYEWVLEPLFSISGRL
jgi:membrane fusion protein